MNKYKVLEIMDKGILLDKYEVYQYTLYENIEKSTFIIYDDKRYMWFLAQWNDYQDYFYFKQIISEEEALFYILNAERLEKIDAIDLDEVEMCLNSLDTMAENSMSYDESLYFDIKKVLDTIKGVK